MVDRREHEDGERGGELAARDCPGESTDGDVEDLVLRRPEGKERAEVLAEADRDRRQAARHDDQERSPAVEEAPQRPVGLTQEDVHAAGVGVHRAELGVGERAGEREQPREHPDPEDHAVVRQHLRHVAGGEEDAGADHRTDGDQRRVPGAEAANEFARSAEWSAHAGPCARCAASIWWKWWVPVSRFGE